MKWAMLGAVGAMCAALGLPQAAQAAVVYEFTGDFYGPIYLRYTSPTPITQDTEVAVGDMDSCSVAAEIGACIKVQFRPLTTVDRLNIYYGENASISYLFDKGAFAAPGVYENRFYRLTVEDQGAVPEPGAWALLIAGFALSGTALRRRLGHMEPRQA